MTIEAVGAYPLVASHRVTPRAIDGLRVAVFHNLHSGGAKRVAHEELRFMARPETWKVFAPSTADLFFAAQEQDISLPSLILPFQPLRDLPSPFGRLSPLVRMFDLVRTDTLARRFARIIDAEGFDVVFVHPSQVTQAPLVLNWLKTPTLYYCQEWPRQIYEPYIPRPLSRRDILRRSLDRVDPLEQSYRLILKALDRRAALQATRIITNSRYSAANIRTAYGRAVDVCYPGVDEKAFNARPRERERMVLSVGALTPNKGFDWIIRGIGTLPQASRPPFVIVSNYAEPAERAFLAQLAAQHGVQVEFRIGVGEGELRDWYARTGCVVYTPVREPLGLVPLEAMAVGAPVIGVAEGGVCETVINGETGLLVRREPAAIGAAIDRLLTDRPLAAHLGAQGRQQVLTQWSWERHVAQVEQLLLQTASRG